MHHFSESSKILINKDAIIIHILKKKLKLIDVNLPGFPKQGQSQSRVFTQSACS